MRAIFTLSRNASHLGRRSPLFAVAASVVLAASLAASGCTSPREYVRNGFKVGSNYCKPQAPVAENYIDANDQRVRSQSDDLSKWWTVFNDPTLDSLVKNAYSQNLTLRQAGCRILEARANLGIAGGNLLPQSQTASGGYSRNAAAIATGSTAGKFSDNWSTGLNLSWELDFWGRFRRAVTAAQASLDASVEDYDDVLVTMLSDVATYYVQYRTAEEQLAATKANAELQRRIWEKTKLQAQVGTVSALDPAQAESTFRQTEAAIPALEISRREAANRLCILMGMPAQDLESRLGVGRIPTAPAEVGVGIPADLLRRRPDVRRAERIAAAQCEMIGIAKADYYPAFYVNGSLGYSAKNFPDLFKYNSFNGSIGPSFQWNIFNYGRILNNVRYQDAYFQELVLGYQSKVLTAGEEAENGITSFLHSQERAKSMELSVVAAQEATRLVLKQYEQGKIDFNRVATIAQNLVSQQNAYAQSRGQIATGLILIYRAIGGGWDIRLEPSQPTEIVPSRLPPVEAPIIPDKIEEPVRAPTQNGTAMPQPPQNP